MSQYKFEIKPTLEKKLIKIKKKDKTVFDATREKIKEIIQYKTPIITSHSGTV